MKCINSILFFFATILFVGCSSIKDSNVPNETDTSETIDLNQIRRILPENLNGWSDGISYDSKYIVAAYDEISKTSHFFISDTKGENGISLIINEEGKLLEVYGNGYKIDVIYCENGYLISWFDDEGQLRGKYIDSTELSTKSSESLLDKVDFKVLGKCVAVLQNIKDVGEIVQDIREGDIYKFAIDISKLSANIALDLCLPAPVALIVSSLSFIVDERNEIQDARYRKAMYNECEIRIDRITEGSVGYIDVYISIEKANTIPSHLARLGYPEPENITQNTVYWGVVGHFFVPYFNFYVEPLFYEDLLNTTISNTQYMMVTFEMPLYNDASYIFRPYLKSTRLQNSLGLIYNNHVKYGDKYKYPENYMIFGDETISLSEVVMYHDCIGFKTDWANDSHVYLEGITSTTIPEGLFTNQWGIRYNRGNNTDTWQRLFSGDDFVSINHINGGEYDVELRCGNLYISYNGKISISESDLVFSDDAIWGI